MPLDSTAGGANANSYISVAEGDAFAAERLYTSAWTAASTPNKEAALIMSTRMISRECFLGITSTSTQALPWPRTGLFNLNGFAIPENVIPIELKLATFELALTLLASTSDITLEPEQSVQGLTKLKAGPVELGFKDDITLKSIPENVLRLLVPSWLCPSSAPAPRVLALG